jgi:hypothetical protein
MATLAKYITRTATVPGGESCVYRVLVDDEGVRDAMAGVSGYVSRLRKEDRGEPEEAASCAVCLEATVAGGEACLYRVLADDERVSARQVFFCFCARVVFGAHTGNTR